MISILVTGANQGIGLAIVKQLLTQASDVLVYAAARSQTKANVVVEELRRAIDLRGNNRVEPFELDITSDEHIQAAVKRIPQLNILVNNAGMYLKEDFSSPTSTRKGLQELYNTNLFGTIALSTALLPKLSEAAESRSADQRPAIVNVSTGLASFANMTTPSSPQYKASELFYASSKTALNVFTVWASKEYPSIRVVAVAPGHTATALNGFKAPQTVDQGAQFITNAVLDFSGPSGIFLQRDKQHPW